VYLGRLFAGAVVNSLALEAAGIVKGGPQPETGTSVYGRQGSPMAIDQQCATFGACGVPRNIGKSDKQAELIAAIERATSEYLK
jgi:predicted amidohydrolase YtcJ